MAEFVIELDGDLFIVCADGQRLLSFKSHLVALRAVADATLLLEQATMRKHQWRAQQWA